MPSRNRLFLSLFQIIVLVLAAAIVSLGDDGAQDAPDEHSSGDEHEEQRERIKLEDGDTHHEPALSSDVEDVAAPAGHAPGLLEEGLLYQEVDQQDHIAGEEELQEEYQEEYQEKLQEEYQEEFQEEYQEEFQEEFQEEYQEEFQEEFQEEYKEEQEEEYREGYPPESQQDSHPDAPLYHQPSKEPTDSPSIDPAIETKFDPAIDSSLDGALGNFADQFKPLLSFESLFAPRMEHYELLRFDPYSFSGAPLGGWGRATRFKLASLPLRLVEDYGGGFDLHHFEDRYQNRNQDQYENQHENQSENQHENQSENQENQRTEEDAPPLQVPQVEINANGEIISIDNNPESMPAIAPKVGSQKPTNKPTNQPTSTTSALPSTGSITTKRSRGPHFIIHDGRGQRYVCRAYHEDELMPSSRIDSMFHPAILATDPIKNSKPSNNLADETNQIQQAGNTNQKDEVHQTSQDIIKEKPRVIPPNGEPVSPELGSKLVEAFNKMGMHEMASNFADMLAQQDEQAVVEHTTMSGDASASEGGALGADLTEIGMAAAVGAGINIPDDETDTTSYPAQLTSQQIQAILSQLRTMCSQIHLGWWSYEWCHEKQVRQFHVVTDQNSQSNGKFGVQDVTLVGMYTGLTQIIYPRGVYDGVERTGTTLSIQHDSKNTVLTTKVELHGKDEDNIYRRRPASGVPSHLFQQYQKRQLGHGGPIVKQFFEGGDVCPEVGYARRMTVELRCCTEDEIGHWLDSKRQKAKATVDSEKTGAGEQYEAGTKNNGGKSSPWYRGKIPKAVLVSVQESEDEICVYRSRVCTPLLCPQETQSKVGDEAKEKKKDSKTLADIVLEKHQNNKASGGILGAAAAAPGAVDAGNAGTVAGAETAGDANPSDLMANLLKSVFADNNGVVEIVTNDVGAALSFERLLSGEGDENDFDQVKKMLLDGAQTKVTTLKERNKKKPTEVEVKEGEGVRDVLKRTLGNGPCLVKNLGWWTYEFCYSKKIRQFHVVSLVDSNTGATKQGIEAQHLLGIYDTEMAEGYPDEEEHLHVLNATSSSSTNTPSVGVAKNTGLKTGGNNFGGNGAVFLQEYLFGDVCDQEDVAESVIKGGNIIEGSVERSSTVRFSCGNARELVDIKEDSTCHYILDVTVPELCQHELFKAPVTKTQVVKCLPA